MKSAEEFINLAYHNFIEATPYTMMFKQPPPREINDMVEFPINPEYQFEKRKFYNRIAEKIEQQKDKYSKNQQKTIKYNIGEKVLIKNRELPSTIEGITKKLLLLLYVGPYTITRDKGNNLSLIHI